MQSPLANCTGTFGACLSTTGHTLDRTPNAIAPRANCTGAFGASLSTTGHTLDRTPNAIAPRAIALDLVPLKQLAADHHALDLGGPLADQQQRRVAIQALDLVLLRIAVAAVDAERFLDAEPAGF